MCPFIYVFWMLDMLELQQDVQGWFELQQWYTGFPLKLHVFCVYGWSWQKISHILKCFYLTSSNLFTFRRFKGRLQYGYGIPYNERERSQINPCCMKTLYHNCVFNSINWITGGVQVTVLEWKWWASVTVARPPFQLWQVNNLIDFPWRLAGLFNATFPV